MEMQKQSRAHELFDMLTDELRREAMANAQERLAGMFGVTLKPEGNLKPEDNLEPSSAVTKALVAFKNRLVAVKKDNGAPATKPKRVVSEATKRKLRKNLKKARAARAEKALAAKRSTKKVVKKTKKK